MSDLYDQIVSQRGSFEQMLARMPGFRGYLDKASRRTADRMLRDHMADLVRQRLDRLIQFEVRILDISGGMKFMSKTSSLKTRMQTYHDRVKAAMPGYSGFMEAVKVENEQLERLYSFDEAQLRYTDRLAEGLDTLEQAITTYRDDSTVSMPVDDAIAALDSIVMEANDAFSLREDVLTNLNKHYTT